MSYEVICSEKQNVLIRQTVEEFGCSIILIEGLSDELYQRIGGHIRHNLDFANLFFSGLETGIINYSKRRRNERIEQDRFFAVEQIREVIHRLKDLPEIVLCKSVEVCSEVDESIRHKSSVMRELEFLHSHTIHHHALIAEKLSNFDLKISAGFGVAPSTLEFWKKRGKAA